jgi:hypothetical protein
VNNEFEGLWKEPEHGLICILSQNMPGETEGSVSVDQGLLKLFVPWTPFESPVKPTDPYLETLFECVK